MKQTFKRRVLKEPPYIQFPWLELTVRKPEATEVQADDRIRHSGYFRELGRHLRVVTLATGETLHRSFKPEES